MATNMLTRWIWSGAVFGLLYSVIVSPLPRGKAQTQEPVLFVVSAATGGGDISLSKLRSAYVNSPTDLNGTRLIPFNLPLGNPARQIVDRALLRISPDKVGAFWIDQRIRTGATPPRAVTTTEMVLRLVTSLRGIIGYVQMNPSLVPAGVDVLSIDGKRPKDVGYPIAPR